MKIIVATAIFILSLSNFSSASCLDGGMLGFMDKSSPEVSFLAFPQCVRANQCSIAKNELEKVKTYDTIKYSFLKGCALANGDCFKQDLKESERLLISCSKQSYTCKVALFNLYSIYGDAPEKYEQFALELADHGYVGAYAFLADLYGGRGTIEGIAKGYFWGKLLLASFENQLKNFDRFENENRAYINHDVKRREQISGDIRNVSSLLKSLESRLPRNVVSKIDGIYLKYVSDRLSNPYANQDALSGNSDVYGVYGRSVTSHKNNQKINLTPPKSPKPDRIQEYENSVLALLG